MSVKKNIKKHFSDDETFTLLNIWKDEKINGMFSALQKHFEIFNKIRNEMKNMGTYDRLKK